MAYQSVNPANGEILRSFDQHTDEQMQRSLATAEGAYQHISSEMAIRDRADLVGREVELSAAILQYPYYQLARFAPHLTAGNVLLVKHASGVPQCALAFEELFTDAGTPTAGSERAGESLASRAGKNLKKSMMELGGSDAFIGPVALFFTAKDEDEAIAIANDSPFGLGGSVYTSDIEHGKRVAGRIETGMVFVNYPTMSAPDLPFGGIKRSGYGKELANLGIEEFVNKKPIWVAPAPAAVAAAAA
jgi:acyl-CoA reductase-like NAD-dependent aldehyde dehydrogenase